MLKPITYLVLLLRLSILCNLSGIPIQCSNVPVLSIATYNTTIVIDICLYNPFIIITGRIQAGTHVDNITKCVINLLSK